MTDFLAPLTAKDCEIMRRLDAGESPQRVAEVGWWRKAWRPSDVARVDTLRRQLAASREVAAQRERAEREPSTTPSRWDDCGTTKAASRHRKKRHERPCDPCLITENQRKAEWRRSAS